VEKLARDFDIPATMLTTISNATRDTVSGNPNQKTLFTLARL